MERCYEHILIGHFRTYRQTAFLSGPRQVGKTTTARVVARALGDHAYFTWDRQTDRAVIVAGPDAVAEKMQIHRLREAPPVCILDELHRYGKWKTFLKGLLDSHPGALRILVTGSARLDVFKAGGDSLMGRYFPYRMHPLSVGELADPGRPVWEGPLPPQRIPGEALAALVRFGGFPEPFLRQEERFWRRWRRLRTQQLLREDLRDLTHIRELGQVEMLAELIRRRVGQLVSHASLARAVNVSVDTIRRWTATLERLYWCFSVRPWHRNVARGLRKEPKYFLWDWSVVEDRGARMENLVASALLKAVHAWTDTGLGDFGLYFIRDKEKREVDFLVTREDTPWFLVEVKASGSARLSPPLARFQEATGAPHAFQVAFDLDYVDRDCFEQTRPLIVPAATFLSQLP